MKLLGSITLHLINSLLLSFIPARLSSSSTCASVSVMKTYHDISAITSLTPAVNSSFVSNLLCISSVQGFSAQFLLPKRTVCSQLQVQICQLFLVKQKKNGLVIFFAYKLVY